MADKDRVPMCDRCGKPAPGAVVKLYKFKSDRVSIEYHSLYCSRCEEVDLRTGVVIVENS